MSGVRHSTEISLQRETSDSEDDANQTVYGIFAGEQSDETDVKSDNWEEFLDEIGTFRAYLTHLQRKHDMLALPAPEDCLQITHGETKSNQKMFDSYVILVKDVQKLYPNSAISLISLVEKLGKTGRFTDNVEHLDTTLIAQKFNRKLSEYCKDKSFFYIK